ncbi:unnamed protein product [Prunus armeniaca]|uniref:Uncharacterized protein n=1 Tax=Prunus armeniaca TaxID=36596 RepID=A0A6J5WNL2_PRUAR|nr:unnamed protein product [Prunus armeniaca]
MASAQTHFQQTLLEEICQLRFGFEQSRTKDGSSSMPWTMNLNCPVFHGGNDNPVDYLCLAELYFKYLKTPELKKVEIASLHLQVMRFHGCQACTSPTTACINGRSLW